ncbi:MAG: hypothetical protein Kow0069_12600 [Promethearchaeota archaeon]
MASSFIAAVHLVAKVGSLAWRVVDTRGWSSYGGLAVDAISGAFLAGWGLVHSFIPSLVRYFPFRLHYFFAYDEDGTVALSSVLGGGRDSVVEQDVVTSALPSFSGFLDQATGLSGGVLRAVVTTSFAVLVRKRGRWSLAVISDAASFRLWEALDELASFISGIEAPEELERLIPSGLSLAFLAAS